MKKIEVKNHIESLKLVSKLKLGGTITKGLVKNALALEEEQKYIDKFRVDLCERYCERDEEDEIIKQYEDDGSWNYTFTPENNKLIEKEYLAFLDEDSKVELIKNIQDALIDQFKDLTLEQNFALKMFSPETEEKKPD